MDLVNETALEVAWTVSRIKPSSFLMTVLAKGTYQMQPDSAAIPADEQLALTGDEFEAGDPAGPLRYSFDFAPFKPRADVLLVGSCHAPGGTPTPTMRVSLQIASITKSLDIVGDRYWRGQNETTQPRPFATMPLTWSGSFGGPGFDANPLGKGFAPVVGPDGRSLHPLPNIESLAQPVRSLTDRVEPAGFGPILDTWRQRLKKFGSFDAGYVKELWPGYPRDFDSGFFNAAPEDQQVEGYLAGDEQYAAENLHKIRPIYRGHLPGIRVRAFLNEHVYVGEQLRELPMRLDTLWIDMDAERLVLVWRGCSPVADASLEDIAHLLFVAEPLSQQGLSTEHYVGVLDEALMRREDEEDEDFEDEDVEDEGVEDESLEAKDTVGTDTEAAEASIQAVAFAEAEPPTAESIEPEEEPVPDDERPLTEKRVREMLAERRSFAGCDLSGLELTRLDFSGCLLREAILQGANLGEVNFSRADLSGAVIAGANLHGATCNGANFAEADLTSAWLVSADLSGTNLQGADLTDAKLRNAVMIESNAAEAVFTGADLSGANLERADLTAADLCESRLHRTNLAGANLSEAALEGAWGRDVTAVSTNLTKIRAAGAHLTRANFREAAGEEAVLEAADLPAADFTGAVLPRAEFTGAQLRDAVFDSATLNGSRFNEADLQRARMVRCNLYESSLDNADLTNADIRESNLFGTTLMDAVLQNTDLQGANLRRVKTREDIP